MVQFSTEQLPELLSVYYKRLFPYEQYYRWLSYGLVNPNAFCNREMSFTLEGEVYIRYQSFDKLEDFEQELIKKNPEKIDIGGASINRQILAPGLTSSIIACVTIALDSEDGAVFEISWKNQSTGPRQKRIASSFEVEEKELVFDIDMTDYDNVRTCCSEANVCIKCWKFMATATKILDAALRDDFGFKHILWVFSGRRGIHCWVCDDVARKLDSKVRSDLAEYLQLLTREDHTGKLAHLTAERMHPSIRRALDIIEADFEAAYVENQDLLGTPSRMNIVLGMMEEGLRQEVEVAWESVNNSLERWQVFKKIFHAQLTSNKLKKRSKHLVDELMLHFSYPRLDINVTKGSNHLLKSPFCIHPKTGKVCIPFKPSAVSAFDPNSVPTISELVEEIQQFDAKESEGNRRRMKDYRKTSMYKGVQVFEEFLRNLEASWKERNSDVSMEF